MSKTKSIKENNWFSLKSDEKQKKTLRKTHIFIKNDGQTKKTLSKTNVFIKEGWKTTKNTKISKRDIVSISMKIHRTSGMKWYTVTR